MKKQIVCGISLMFLSSNAFSDNCMHKIPKKIWQTYLTKNLPEPARNAQHTWLLKNKGYRYALWDDADIEMYILMRWPRNMYDFFKSLPIGVMKADLWRYLILKTEGGIYSDIDSECRKPLKDWVSSETLSSTSENILLLGLENDVHFCQWTIAVTQEHPAMEFVCNYILDKWERQGIDLKNVHFVHATTGPGIWTEALVCYLGEVPGTKAEEIYRHYTRDHKYKKKVNELGIYLFPQTFYGGEASKNLYGSQCFGDGYKHWVDEAVQINEQSK